MKLFEEIYIRSKTRDNDVSLDDLLDEAKQAYKYLLDGHKFRTRNGYPVRFTQRGFNEFFYSVESVMNDDVGKAATKQINANKHCMDDLLNTVQYLGDIIETADFEYYSKNHKLDHKKEIKGYEHWNCPVIIDGKKKTVHIVLEKRFQDKDRAGTYYYHHLKLNESQLQFEVIIHQFEVI
jgi:hypothetical protein